MRGCSYIAITDHSKALAMANGLDEARALAQAARIRAIDGEATACGSSPASSATSSRTARWISPTSAWPRSISSIASVHSAFTQDRQQMTERLLRAIENLYVDIVGHPTGRRILKREPYPFDLDAVVDAAARYGVALEINCQVDRLDLSDTHARLARDRGAPIVISTDAHASTAFERLRWGVLVAQRAWLAPADVLNTRPLAELTAGLRRNRRRA